MALLRRVSELVGHTVIVQKTTIPLKCTFSDSDLGTLQCNTPMASCYDIYYACWAELHLSASPRLER